MTMIADVVRETLEGMVRRPAVYYRTEGSKRVGREQRMRVEFRTPLLVSVVERSMVEGRVLRGLGGFTNVGNSDTG